jgi:hypothetical protein
MASTRRVEWRTCRARSCIGVCLATTPMCWAHAADEHVDAALGSLHEGGDLDARGVPITSGLLQRFLSAAPTGVAGHWKLKNADFSWATFKGEVSLHLTIFNGQTRFDGATFKNNAGFGGATFQGKASFTNAIFEGDVDLDGATFEDEVDLGGATFKGFTAFNGATLEYQAMFNEATFELSVDFSGATFRDWTVFDEATFEEEVVFDYAIFEADTSFSNASFKNGARFGDATFKGHASFSNTSFQEMASFEGSTFGSWTANHAAFKGQTSFDGATFQGLARFRKSTFQQSVMFEEAAFQDVAAFGQTKFEGEVGFQRVTFEDLADFDGTMFEGGASFIESTFSRTHFLEATFKGAAFFQAATFKQMAMFSGSTFEGPAWFNETTFEHEAHFDEATFETARDFGPTQVRRQLDLRGATFKQRVHVEAAAATLCANEARFPNGVQFRLRWAQVVLDDADLAAPSILTGIPSPDDPDLLDQFATRWRRLPPRKGRDGRPRVLSMRRADVAGLTIANADLRACRFLGAHNLDKLHVEGDASFGYTPSPWRWTTRQTLAEEHHWRARRAAPGATTPPSVGRGGWGPAHYRSPDWLNVEDVSPAQIVGLYRALRKAREDNKDEPGAADFYYGEMEMRRHARHDQAREERRRRHWGTWAAARVEHAILWLYWLVSGYALRAWRALAAFAALLVMFAAVCVYWGGFASPATSIAVGPIPTTTAPGGSTPTSRPSSGSASTARSAPTSTPPAAPTSTTPTGEISFGGALVYGARTVIGLTRDPQPRLTRRGDVAQILLRFLGPVLLGLAILSVRGRVKR